MSDFFRKIYIEVILLLSSLGCFVLTTNGPEPVPEAPYVSALRDYLAIVKYGQRLAYFSQGLDFLRKPQAGVDALEGKPIASVTPPDVDEVKEIVAQLPGLIANYRVTYADALQLPEIQSAFSELEMLCEKVQKKVSSSD